MNKIALLYERRIARQERFLTNPAKLESYEGLEKHSQVFTEILEARRLKDYKLLMLHKSDIDVSIIENICKENRIALVIFSGEITSTLYSDSLGFPYLKINSKLFYDDENLFYFLEDFFNNPNEVNLLKLAYGEKWKISAWLAFRQKIKLVKSQFQNWGTPSGWDNPKMSNLYEEIRLNSVIKTALPSNFFVEDATGLPLENALLFLEKWEQDLTTLINQELR